MRSFLCICLIVVLFLFTTTCNIRQFIPQKEKYGAIYEEQNLVALVSPLRAALKAAYLAGESPAPGIAYLPG
jgi:hypothetical protein